VQELRLRWPQINLEAVHWGIYEPEVVSHCSNGMPGSAGRISGGSGEYQQLAVLRVISTAVPGIACLFQMDRSFKRINTFFACGPWLGKLFPETIGKRIVRPGKKYFLWHSRRKSTFYRG